MKNANTRFVRVLALVLVVLMVVPAALVGCGSNKANNAAISEALAAAEAARKEAEEAKAAADAAAAEAAAKAAEEAAKALEEATKKAEEAIKAAEDAKKEAEEAKKEAAEAAKTTAAPATTAPVTTAAPATEDMKIVSEYAYAILNDHNRDFLKAYYTYAFGATEEDFKKDEYKGGKTPNPAYAPDDFDYMVELYGKTQVAILQATSVDYINAIVANFVATIAATPTYVERIVDAYAAIDTTSNYDVIDVVYANALLAKAIEDLDKPGKADAYADFKDALTKYGEDKIDVMEAIATEYYRYTNENALGLADTSDLEDDDILYADMYEAADAILVAVKALIENNAPEVHEEDEDLMKLDAAKLPYDAKVESLVANVVKEYTKWNTKYFVNADDKDLVNYYDAFRQAFVGEDYILVEDTDYVWEALVAFEARATELLTAAAEYEADFKTELNSVAKQDPAKISYAKYIEKVANVDAALEAWKLKYGFKENEEGEIDPNVTAIIVKYDDYALNAAIVSYFVYLEKIASAVNASAFLNAYKEDLHDNDTVVFTFSKYGSAVASVLDWYFGKEKNGTRDLKNAFISITPNEADDFFALLDSEDDDYKVATLIKNNDSNVVDMFERAIGLDIEKNAGAFDAMLATYTALRKAKEAADEINDDIEEYLEKGVSVKAEADLKALLGDDYAEIFDPDVEDEDKYTNLDGDLEDWLDEYDVIDKGDANFIDMIDWANIETLYDNYNGSTKNIKEAAVEVALMYIAWKGTYDAENETITYKDKTLGDITFEDLDPIEINIYSYDIVKKALDLYDALDVKNAGSIDIEVPVNNDEDYTVTLKDVANFCVELRTHFYSIVDTLQIAVYNTIYNDYPLLAQNGASKNNPWRSATHYSDKLADREFYYDRVVNAGDRVNENNDPNNKIKPAILDVLKDNNFTRYSTGQFGNTNNVPAGAGLFLNTEPGKTNEYVQFKNVSYEYAVYSVNPLSYATMSAEGKVVSFDSAAYKTALQTSIANTYKAYLNSYYKNSQATFDGIIDIVAINALNTGIWTIADEIVIADEEYAFQIDTDKFGTAWELEILDADTDVVKLVNASTVEIKVEPKNNEFYTITLTATLNNGVLKITPTVVALENEDGVKGTKDVYDLVAGLNKDDFEGEDPYFAYDVRDYAEQIAANGDKVTDIVLLGGKKATLDTLSAAQYETLFNTEAKNDFYHAFKGRVDAMYNANTTYATWLFGKFFTDFANKGIADAVTALTTKLADADKAEAVVADLVKISQAAYQLSYGMTFEANSIDDIAEVYDAFVLEVCHKLDEHEVGYTYNAASMTLTIKAVQ